MRALVPAVLTAAAVVLTGCASIGDPLPPALNIPRAVTDVAAVQRGADLIITFTAPATTTEDLVLEKFGGIDVRVSDKQVTAETPDPGKPVTVRVPAAEWSGQDVRVQVRVAGPGGRYSTLSEPLVVNVGPRLATPRVTAEPHPSGVRLSWPAVGGEQYRVIRDETQIGTSATAEFLDTTAQFGKEYKYSVQAFINRRESEPSAVVAITPRDQFPPAAPKGLQAVPGLRSVELAWERNTEPDLGTYRVYRAAAQGDFAVLVDGVEGIAFSDRQVEPGTTYRYRITALDKSGNEGEPTAVLEVRVP